VKNSREVWENGRKEKRMMWKGGIVTNKQGECLGDCTGQTIKQINGDYRT